MEHAESNQFAECVHKILKNKILDFRLPVLRTHKTFSITAASTFAKSPADKSILS